MINDVSVYTLTVVHMVFTEREAGRRVRVTVVNTEWGYPPTYEYYNSNHMWEENLKVRRIRITSRSFYW